MVLAYIFYPDARVATQQNYLYNELIINMMDIRIGNGYDVHALAPELPLWLGGVQVESPIGCIAHSDGDVAIHALCDALLGALALGDIGKHFPDTSNEFKGIDSKILLARVMELVRAEAGRSAMWTLPLRCRDRSLHLISFRCANVWLG